MATPKTYEELQASKINPRNYSAILPIIYSLNKRANKDYFPEAPIRIIHNDGVVGDGECTAIFNALALTPPASYSKATLESTESGILLTGTAQYVQTDGTTPSLKAANEIVAQIDMTDSVFRRTGIAFQARPQGIEVVRNVATNAWAVSTLYNVGDLVIGSNGQKYRCNTRHTSTNNDRPITGGVYENFWGNGEIGAFSFYIPWSRIKNMALGKHTVYIDAKSTNSNPVRLTASGGLGSDPSNLLTYNVREFILGV